MSTVKYCHWWHISTEWCSAATAAAVRGREGRRGGRGWGWGEAWRPGRPAAGWGRLQRGRRGRLRQGRRQPLSERKPKIYLHITVHWNYLCIYVPVLLMWWDIMKKTFELHTVLRIRDVYPESLIFTHPGSRIPDLWSRIQNRNKRERWKKISCHTFLSGHKFQNIVIILVFKCWRKKIWSNFQRIIELFTKKIAK